MRFHIGNPEGWGYPLGLDEAITRTLEQQGLPIVATNASGQTVYIQAEHSLGGNFWCLFDNGGELCLEQPNTEVHHGLSLTSNLGMPTDVEKYALLLIIWIIASIRGQPIDYTWRP